MWAVLPGSPPGALSQDVGPEKRTFTLRGILSPPRA